MCPLCIEIIKSPYQLNKCHHSLCHQCILDLEKNNNFKCPQCTQSFKTNDYKKNAQLAQKMNTQKKGQFFTSKNRKATIKSKKKKSKNKKNE